MTGRPDRVRSAPRSAARGYFRKAEEFRESMRQALSDKRWNAVGLNAVHCAISCSDAVVVYHMQQRPAGADHQSAAQMLGSLSKVPDANQKAQTLRKVLAQKNLVEYEDRALTQQEATEMAKLVERLYEWAAKQLA